MRMGLYKMSSVRIFVMVLTTESNQRESHIIKKMELLLIVMIVYTMTEEVIKTLDKANMTMKKKIKI